MNRGCCGFKGNSENSLFRKLRFQENPTVPTFLYIFKMIALTPDELSVLCSIDSYSPLNSNDLYQMYQNPADSPLGIKERVEEALAGLKDNSLIISDKGIYRVALKPNP